jgi:predicted RNA-binding Zn-ribbon protein involved in translation (DUF1610 family)
MMAKSVEDVVVREILNEIVEQCVIDMEEKTIDEDEYCNAVFIQVLSQIDEIFEVKGDLSFDNNDEMDSNDNWSITESERGNKPKTVLFNEEGYKEGYKVDKKSSYQRCNEAYVKKFTTFSDVQDLCSTKKGCIKFLIEMGVINDRYRCPKCGNEMVMHVNSSSKSSSDGFVWICRKTANGQRHQCHRSIRKGSWISDCNLTLEEIIQAVYHWSQNFYQHQIMHESLFASHTAVEFGRKCRVVCEHICIKESEPIGGENVIIEIDETKVGKRKYNK